MARGPGSMLRSLLQELEHEGAQFIDGPEPGTLLMTAFEYESVNPPAVWIANEEETGELVKRLSASGHADGVSTDDTTDEPSAVRGGLQSLMRSVSDRLASVGPAGARVEITAERLSVVGHQRSQMNLPPGTYRWTADNPE